MVVYIGQNPAGASLCKYHYHVVLNFLKRQLCAPKWMVWVSMGSDLVNGMNDGVVEEQLITGIVNKAMSLLDSAHRWVPQNMMIFGGGKGMWSGVAPLMYSDAFETASRAVVIEMRQKGYQCDGGGWVWRSMCAVDDDGHVAITDRGLQHGLIDLALESRLKASGAICRWCGHSSL